MPRQTGGTRGRRPPRGESSGWEDVDDDWAPTRDSQSVGRGRGRGRNRQTSFLLLQGNTNTPFSDGVRRYQELLREERQRRRWQRSQPRLGAITTSEVREDPEESSDEERPGRGQQTVASELTIGGCSGNAGRPSVSTPHVVTPPASSSSSPFVVTEGRREGGRTPPVPSSSSSPVAPEGRRESGREAVEVRKEKEADAAWWEGSETQGVPVFGWFFGGTEGGELVAAYLADGQAMLLSADRYQEGIRRARRHLLGEEGEPPARQTVNLYAPVQLGARRYLSEYARERKTLPRQELWAKVLNGEKDHRGETVAAEFFCQSCARRRRVPVRWAKGIEDATREGMAVCQRLLGGTCDDGRSVRELREWEVGGQGDNDWMYKSLREEEAERGREGREKQEGRDEVKREEEDSGSEGFSAAAKQFYKATGKFMQVPTYRGETSEVELLAWIRGTERYFATYGIHQEREKVTIAADLLGGEASLWWNGLWMSGRDKEITTWQELMEKLRERFLPPEGEMKVVGQWKRLHQVGPVANYADYVFRLKALCDMGQAEFKLTLYGLRPELQAEVRKHLRQNKLFTMTLEALFAVATDAEVGLGGGKRTEEGGEIRKKDKVRVHAIKGEEKGKPKNNNGSRSEKEGIGGKAGEICWVCDKTGHGWYYCPAKIRGQCCPRCGSTAHRLYTCPQRPNRAQGEGVKVPFKTVSVLQRVFAQNDLPFDGLGLRFYKVKLHKKETRVLVDSGASVNCIDAEVLNRLGGEIKRVAPGRLYLADQR